MSRQNGADAFRQADVWKPHEGVAHGMTMTPERVRAKSKTGYTGEHCSLWVSLGDALGLRICNRDS